MTLDDFVQEHRLHVGFIKADVEGMGLELLQGALKTICNQRPVMSLAAYHCPEELFGQYELLSKNLVGYHFSFTNLPPMSGYELTMLAYPAEVDAV